MRTDQAATLIVKIIENKKLSDELKPETGYNFLSRTVCAETNKIQDNKLKQLQRSGINAASSLLMLPKPVKCDSLFPPHQAHA